MSLNDWEIKDDHLLCNSKTRIKILLHLHEWDSILMRHRTVICAKSDEGYWICPHCKTKAPEEIAFVADLAKCWTHTDEIDRALFWNQKPK